jgi:hypothetical protein
MPNGSGVRTRLSNSPIRLNLSDPASLSKVAPVGKLEDVFRFLYAVHVVLKVRQMCQTPKPKEPVKPAQSRRAKSRACWSASFARVSAAAKGRKRASPSVK